MHLPVMDRVYHRNSYYISKSSFEIFFGSPVLVALTLALMAFISLVSSGFIVAVLNSVITFFVTWLLVLLLVFISRLISYRKLIKDIRGSYHIKPNSYFKIINDNINYIVVALAYGYEDDFNPKKLVLAEYYLESEMNDFHRSCQYETQVGAVFFTKYGFLIKIHSVDNNDGMEFEIVGLRKMGLLFS